MDRARILEDVDLSTMLFYEKIILDAWSNQNSVILVSGAFLQYAVFWEGVELFYRTDGQKDAVISEGPKFPERPKPVLHWYIMSNMESNAKERMIDHTDSVKYH